MNTIDLNEEETLWTKEDEALLNDRLRRARRDAHYDADINLALPQLLSLQHLITDVNITVDEEKPGIGVEFLPSPMTFDHNNQYYTVRVYVSLHPCMARMILGMCNGQRLTALRFETLHGRHNEGLAYLIGENADRSALPRIQILNYAKELEWISDRIDAEWEDYIAAHLTDSSD